MAFSICLKIGNIAGESAIGKHEGEIDVLSWHWGLTQSHSGQTGSKMGTGTADVQDLTFTKYVDKASPTLIQECFYGTDQTSAVLTVIRASGKEALEFIKITMSGTVIVSSVRTGDPLPNAADRYSETVTLNFSHVKFEYTPLAAGNSKGATAVGEFSIVRQT
jgi:type VI secretion system secreted protein Hcp